MAAFARSPVRVTTISARPAPSLVSNCGAAKLKKLSGVEPAQRLAAQPELRGSTGLRRRSDALTLVSVQPPPKRCKDSVSVGEGGAPAGSPSKQGAMGP